MKWRWAKDKWNSEVTGHGYFKSDKLLHCLLPFMGTVVGLIFAYTFIASYWYIVPAIILFIGIIWEVKDALYPYETGKVIKFKKWEINLGGDGFSWKDIVSDIMGIAVGILIYFLIF